MEIYKVCYATAKLFGAVRCYLNRRDENIYFLSMQNMFCAEVIFSSTKLKYV